MQTIQTQSIQTQSIPSLIWFLRGGRWFAYFFACAGYLSGVLSTQHLTLLSLFLLTMIYGAWLVSYWMWFREQAQSFWLLALFCLACISQFIPLPGTNLYWLPLLPTITASMMTIIRPRFLGLLAGGILWLSSSLAFGLLGHDWDVSSQAILLISFLFTFGFVAMIRELSVAHDALESSNADLATAHTRLQEYSNQVEEFAAIRERNRIARDIHDTLGHALTLLTVQLETAMQLEARGDPRLHVELLEARRVAKVCLTEVRYSVEALRPDEALVDSLQEQLRRLVTEFETTCHETRVTLDLEEAIHPLHPELRLTLYRCAQEAFTNIRKHARATKVLLRLSTRGGQEDRVELTVLDNGQGSPPVPEHRVSGFGLLGMRERVALLDGTLQAGPEPSQGWRVEVLFPLKIREQVEVRATRARTTREKV